MRPHAPGSGERVAIEPRLALTLRAGTYLSVGLLAIGSMLLIVTGTSPVSGGPPLSLDQLVRDLAALRPAGLLWLGVLGVLATPALRVLHAIVALAGAGERRMALVGASVLGVIAAGVIVAVMAA